LPNRKTHNQKVSTIGLIVVGTWLIGVIPVPYDALHISVYSLKKIEALGPGFVTKIFRQPVVGEFLLTPPSVFDRAHDNCCCQRYDRRLAPFDSNVSIGVFPFSPE
jgi:hypothetical protein